MAWQTAPGMIVIVGGFSLVGGLFAGIDGLRNWIYKKVSMSMCGVWLHRYIERVLAGCFPCTRCQPPFLQPHLYT